MMKSKGLANHKLYKNNRDKNFKLILHFVAIKREICNQTMWKYLDIQSIHIYWLLYWLVYTCTVSMWILKNLEGTKK